MAKPFIPDADAEFRDKACSFASTIAQDPGRFKLSGADAEIINRAFSSFEQARMAVANSALRSGAGVTRKNQEREKLERVLRKYGRLIRADEAISASAKLLLGIEERPAKLTSRDCPQTRPVLIYKGARDATSMRGPVHVLAFREEPYFDFGSKRMAPQMGRAKPPGAARVEVYVELVDEGEATPEHPGELSGGRPWYLRSFTRTPMEVEVPVCARPMLVVYWARWADAKGNVGPFSKTCVARVEGWATLHASLPDPMQVRQRQQRIIITSARRELPEPVEQVEAIEMREVKLLEQA